MAAVTICRDFGAPKIKSATVSIVSSSICHEVMEPDTKIFLFWMLSFKPAFSLYSFTFIKRLFSSSLLSAIRVVSSVYLKLLIFLPAILIPTCASSSPAFLMMCRTYKLNNLTVSGSLFPGTEDVIWGLRLHTVNHHCVLGFRSPGQLHGQMALWPQWAYPAGLRTRSRVGESGRGEKL